MKRRDFVKTMAMSGVAVAASDIVADLIAQTPQGKVLESKFKGLVGHRARRSQDGRAAAMRTSASRVARQRGNASGGNRDFDDLAVEAGRWSGGGGRRWRSGGGGGGVRVAVAARRTERAAGFGVRVIHSGVLGIRQQSDRHRR